MSSRRSVRQLLVGVVLGVLVGGGLMAVTPAGAEVSNAVATNWKKIWKKNLKPLADRRYYTKAQSDTKYATKAESAASAAAAQAGATSAANAATDSKLASYYKKTESDAKYAAAGSSYTKTESDAKYVAKPGLITGGWGTSGFTSGAGVLEAPISFGVTLAAAPTTHFIPAGATPPADCPGTLTAPNASPGHLCVYEQSSGGLDARSLCNFGGFCPGVNVFGTFVFASDQAGGADRWMRGTWALRPGGAATVAPSAAAATVVPTPSRSGPVEAGVSTAR